MLFSNQRVSESRPKTRLDSVNQQILCYSMIFCAIRGNTDNGGITTVQAISVRLGLSSTSRVMAGMEA